MNDLAIAVEALSRGIAMTDSPIVDADHRVKSVSAIERWQEQRTLVART
jgi:hypothetical protein